MSRRRGLRGYARRNWRVPAFVAVAVVGTVLFSSLADRGHDPLWRDRPGEAATLALSDDGGTGFAALRGPSTVTTLEARDLGSGELLWTVPVHAPGAVLAAGADFVALATGFPGAALRVYGERTGNLLHEEFLDGNPRAMTVDGKRIAVALASGRNPVMLLGEDFTPEGTVYPHARVLSIAYKNGTLAVGGAGGNLLVLRGTMEVINTTRPYSLRSVALSAAGDRLLVGGFALGEGDLSGNVASLDVSTPEARLLWEKRTALGVGFVDLDETGTRAIAVEESIPAYRVHAYDVDSGVEAWSHEARGAIYHDDSGSVGGAAISPAGDTVAVAPISGRLLLLDGGTGALRWSFDSAGSTALAFAPGAPRVLFANARLVANQPHDALLGFDAAEEPLVRDVRRVVPLLVAAEVVGGALVLGLGYVRERRM